MRSCYNQHAAHSLLECPTCRALVRREAVLLALRFRNGCERAPEGNYITSRNRICAPWVENVDHSLMNRLLAREAWDRVLAPLGLRALLQALNSKILVWWLRCRTYHFTQVLWKGLDTLILLGCWILWKSGIREFSEEGRARGTCV